jgi:NADH:ubiquinone oxidoreductase subunit 2 (subunit N)
LGAALFLALGGVPPTAGFLAELLIFWEAIKARLYGPVLLAALAALIALVYYLGLIRDMYFDEPPSAEARKQGKGASINPLVLICGVVSAFFGTIPILFWLFV